MNAFATNNLDDAVDEPRRRPTMVLAVVGGSLIVSATALAAFGILNTNHMNNATDQNIDEQDAAAISRQYPGTLLLPLPPTATPSYRPSIRPSASSLPSQSPSTSVSPSSQPSSIPSTSVKPSSGPSESPSTTSKPSGNPSFVPSVAPSAVPSVRPTALPSISIAPTFYPTRKPTKRPTRRPTHPPTELVYSISSSGTFHLRLHWQPGFYWQEESEESWWCMACAWCNQNIFDEHCDAETYCRENMSLALVNCSPYKMRRSEMAVFTLVKKGRGRSDAGKDLEGDQIQVSGTDLCLELAGTRSILLQQCNPALEEQRFLGFVSGGQAMELAPEGSYEFNGVKIDRCLTQHHHPRPGERVYAQECRLARNSETNLWSTY